MLLSIASNIYISLSNCMIAPPFISRQTWIKCCSAVATLQAEQGPCEPSKNLIRKIGEQQRARESNRDPERESQREPQKESVRARGSQREPERAGE